MRYVQLRAFHNVAVHGGFSRAANALNLTQPAISDQVCKLEDEYGIVLFNRRKKRVEVTEAGQQLLEITHRLFESESQALDFLTDSRALRSGTLRIAADSAYHVVQILGQFRERHPSVKVIINSGNSAEVIAQLQAFEADIGVLGEAPDTREFLVQDLGSTPLIAFAAKIHPLAKKKSITLTELSAETIVVREAGSKTRELFEATLSERGLPFKPHIEAEGREAVREIVASGTAVGIVSAAEFDDRAGLVPITISDIDIAMNEALICMRDRAKGKLVTAFMDVAASLSGTGAPSSRAPAY